MGYAEAHVVALTTDSGGDFIGYTPVVSGRVHSIKYTKDDFDNGVDFTITSDVTLQNIWVEDSVDAAKTVAPRQPTHSTVGVASLYSTANSEPVETPVVVANERIKIVIANGGNAKSGSITVIVE